MQTFIKIKLNSFDVTMHGAIFNAITYVLMKWANRNQVTASPVHVAENMVIIAHK